MESMNTLCLLVLFLAIVSTPGSTGLHLGVSFEPLNAVLHDKMHVKCEADGKVMGARMSLMMKIGKVGEKHPLAICNLVTDITTGPINASKTITAVGHMDKVSKKSFLTVTIDRPDEEDSGTYRCQLLYVDRKFKVQEDKELFNVTIDPFGSEKIPGSNGTDQGSNKSVIAPDTSALMKYLVKQLADLKDTVKVQKEMISDLKDTVKVQKEMISDLKDTVTANAKSTQSHDRVLAELNATDIAMRDQLQDFQTKATYQCAFMAKYQKGDKFEKLRPIQFSGIVLNQGEAYNPERSVFTAPVDGLYIFHLTIGTGTKGGNVSAYLRINGKDVSKLFASDKEALDQSSTSAVVHLQPDDMVYLWLIQNDGILLIDGYTTFSGVLIHAT